MVTTTISTINRQLDLNLSRPITMLTSSSGHQQQPLQSQSTATNSIDHQINVPMTNLEEGGTVAAAAAATGGVGGGAGGAAAIGAEYASSLADLTVNSKPLINMLTMLAEENERFAGTIVKAIETHLAEVRIFSCYSFKIDR